MVTALSLVRWQSAKDVPLSTYVLNARALMHPKIVLFVARSPLKRAVRPPNPNPAIHVTNSLPTPVQVNRLIFFLSGYDPSIEEEIRLGFQFGFPLHFRGLETSCCFDNLQSALQNPEVVDLKIQKELHAGRISGPCDTPPFSPFRVSPLGVVPKKSLGEFRLIHHLSHPKGSSVNDGIP